MYDSVRFGLVKLYLKECEKLNSMIMLKFLKILDGIELSSDETKCLESLSTFQASTINNFCSILEKARKNNKSNAGRKNKIPSENVILLREQGKTLEEIAFHLGVSVSTVRNYIKKYNS